MHRVEAKSSLMPKAPVTMTEWLRISGLLLASNLAQSPFEVHGYIQGQFTDRETVPGRLETRRARVAFQPRVSKRSFPFVATC